MAWTSAALPTVETTALATDAPLLVATHVSDAVAAGSRARWNAVGDWDTADASSTTLLARHAVDRSGLRLSSPSTAGATRYLVLNASVSTSFDCILIEHDNLDTADLSTVISRSDASNFGSPTTLSTLGPLNAGRHFIPLSVRVTGTGYLRLAITIGSGTFTPAIREVWFGRRRQFRAVPKLSVDYAARRSARAASGTISRDGLVLHTQRGVVAAQFMARDAESTLRDRDTIAAVWSESQGGRWPVLFVPRPTSAPHEAQIMRLQAPAYDLTRDDFGSRLFALDMLEQAPFLRSA